MIVWDIIGCSYSVGRVATVIGDEVFYSVIGCICSSGKVVGIGVTADGDISTN